LGRHWFHDELERKLAFFSVTLSYGICFNGEMVVLLPFGLVVVIFHIGMGLVVFPFHDLFVFPFNEVIVVYPFGLVAVVYPFV